MNRANIIATAIEEAKKMIEEYKKYECDDESYWINEIVCLEELIERLEGISTIINSQKPSIDILNKRIDKYLSREWSYPRAQASILTGIKQEIQSITQEPTIEENRYKIANEVIHEFCSHGTDDERLEEWLSDKFTSNTQTNDNQ